MPVTGTSVCPSTKSFSDFNEIWFVDRRRWMMHDGMPYDPIQDQSQGHRASEVPKIAPFYICLLCHLQCQLANDHWFLNYSTISKFSLAGFLLFVLVFVRCKVIVRTWVLWHCWLGGRKGIRPVNNMGDDGAGHWLVWMEWRPARWSVCLPV